MKKIGIISQFNLETVNFGNRLQAFALNRYLSVHFPEYKTETLYFNFYDKKLVTRKISPLQYVKHKTGRAYQKLFGNNITTNKINTRLKNCNKFSQKYMNLCDRAYSWETLLQSDYDFFMVGSDVVWSQGHNGIGRVRFLDFTTGKPFNKIAYSASFGRDFIPEENIEAIKRCLSKFSAISVREASSVNMLESLGIKACHTLDPVMLLDMEEWAHYMQKPEEAGKIKTKGFIFTYLLGTSRKMRKDIQLWAKLKKLDIVSVPYASGYYNYADNNFGDVQVMDCSPENWIWLICNASYVVTDSFHGAVFSTIFIKKFWVLERIYSVDINNRMYDFLKLTGQLDKMVKSGMLKETGTMEWDYKNTEKIIQAKKQFSKEYLEKALRPQAK